MELAPTADFLSLGTQLMQKKQQEDSQNNPEAVAGAYMGQGMLNGVNAIIETKKEQAKQKRELLKTYLNNSNIELYKVGEGGKSEDLNLNDFSEAIDKYTNTGKLPDNIMARYKAKEARNTTIIPDAASIETLRKTFPGIVFTPGVAAQIPESTYNAAINAQARSSEGQANRDWKSEENEKDRKSRLRLLQEKASTTFKDNTSRAKIASYNGQLAQWKELNKLKNPTQEQVAARDALKETLESTEQSFIQKYNEANPQNQITQYDIETEDVPVWFGLSSRKGYKAAPKEIAVSNTKPNPTPPTGIETDKVIVEKEGKQYKLPKKQLNEAIKQGYKLIK